MDPALLETIERSRARLGLSAGEVLAVARELFHDRDLATIDRLADSQAHGLIVALDSLVSVG